MIQIIAEQDGTHYTDEEVAALILEEKFNWLRHNPVTAARHFQYRLNTFFQDFLEIHKLLTGMRIDFQARDSPHAHCNMGQRCSY